MRRTIVQRWLPALPLLLLAGIIWYMAASLKSDPETLSLTDLPVPSFALEPLPGLARGLATADLIGQVQVVNFFASWCTPCLAEHPLLTDLAHRWPQSIHGINFQDRSDQALAWLERHGNPYWRLGYDPHSHAAIEWRVIGVPETFVIDQHGRIRYRHFGPLTEKVVRQTILPLLEQN